MDTEKATDMKNLVSVINNNNEKSSFLPILCDHVLRKLLLYIFHKKKEKKKAVQCELSVFLHILECQALS